MIDPITAAATSGFLQGITAQMAGMSASDAYDEYITQNYESDEIQIGYGTKTSSQPSISGNTAGTVVESTEPVAVDAFNDYVENEIGDTSKTTGGALDGSNVKTGAYSLMIPAQGNDLQAVMPVGVPLEAAIVAANQALGVSVDAANLDAELKQKYANSIVQGGGMIYDKAKDLVLAWKDALGNILFPKKVIESLATVNDEEGIGKEGESYSEEYPGIIVPTGPASYKSPNSSRLLSAQGATFYRVGNSIYGASANPGSFQYEYASSETYIRTGTANLTRYSTNNKVYYIGSVNASISQIYSPRAASGPSVNWQNAGYIVVHGDTIGVGYPTGTSQSEATSYTPSTIPDAGSLMSTRDGRIPLVPINIPENPYDATGSTIDPTTETDDENAGVIYPGLTGKVPDTANPDAEPKDESIPVPLPIPDTNVSNPDVPLTNASVVDSTLINELVEELADTLDPQPPQSSGIIPIPPMPGIIDPDTGDSSFPSIVPSSGSGFIHVYNPTPAEFVSFGNWLWVTYADATIDKIWNNPFDGVIGAHELYATPNRDGRDNIRSGFLTCPTAADLVRNRYSEIDCGTVIVPEFYGNYLDYSPYSQAYIYLPFIGINEVSIDDIVGHAVNIRYRIDSYTGSCIAMIFVAKSGYQNLCYQFAGNCAVEVPLAGGSQAAIKAGVLQAEAYARAAMISSGANAISGLGSALMGNLSGALSSAAYMATNYANAQAGVEAARVANKSSVQHSGQFGASHGAMGEKIPFIIIRNPVQVKVVNYNNDYGYPAHKRVIIGGCTGYLRVREVNVISAHATDAEKAAIEAMLKNGVYVS